MAKTIKPFDKERIQKIIKRMESGDFDENDVYNILMALRAFPYGNEVFVEIAHFVAHNNNRNQGITFRSLEAADLTLKYFINYPFQKKQLNLQKSFPLYLIKFMKYQIDKCEEKNLKKKFKMNKKQLKKLIDSTFSLNEKEQTASLKEDNFSEKTYSILKYLFGFISIGNIYNQDQVISEFIKVIKANKLIVNETEILKHSNKITVCVMLLLHKTEFEYGCYGPSYCKISCEKEAIIYNQKPQNFIDKNKGPAKAKDSFGNLRVMLHYTIDLIGKKQNVNYNLMETNVSTEDWCDKEMFITETVDEKLPDYLSKKITFDEHLCLNNEGKISIINSQ